MYTISGIRYQDLRPGQVFVYLVEHTPANQMQSECHYCLSPRPLTRDDFWLDDPELFRMDAGLELLSVTLDQGLTDKAGRYAAMLRSGEGGQRAKGRAGLERLSQDTTLAPPQSARATFTRAAERFGYLTVAREGLNQLNHPVGGAAALPVGGSPVVPLSDPGSGPEACHYAIRLPRITNGSRYAVLPVEDTVLLDLEPGYVDQDERPRPSEAIEEFLEACMPSMA